MKISQLIATKQKTQYHESVASRLPRGIKSQQQLLNFGYGIAVRDLGLLKASSLNENFAAKLVNSYHKQCLDEGIGSFLGKAAGHVAGAAGAAGRGLKSAWQDAKQGYATAKSVWDPKDAPGTHPTGAEPATPGAPAATPGAPAATPTPGAPAATPGAPAAAPTPGAPAAEPAAPAAAPATGDISSIMQTIDKLDKPTKQQLAGELEKNIAAAPEPAPAEPAAAPATPAPATPATDTATPGPAGTTYDPAKAAADKLAKGQADQQLAQQQMDATKQANAATAGQDAAIKAAADAAKAKPPFQQTASDKMAIKAAADKGIREAEEKKKKLKKKIVAEFKSNFLGRTI